jgi:hypothetical protein
MIFAHSMSLAITRLVLARRGASFTYKLMDKYSQLFQQLVIIFKFEHKQVRTAVKSKKYKEWYNEKQKKEPGKIN